MQVLAVTSPRERDSGSRDTKGPRSLPMWTLVSAVSAPAVLLGSCQLSRDIRVKAYDPMTQTMSQLASGASDVVMTVGIVVSALCVVVTAAGLYVLPLRARVPMAVAGCCGVALAGLPVSHASTEIPHLVVAGSAAVLFASCPLLAMSTRPNALVVLRVRWAIVASAVLFGLLAWVFVAMGRGPDLGLAERVAAIAEMMWPLTVVIAAYYVSRR